MTTHTVLVILTVVVWACLIGNSILLLRTKQFNKQTRFTKLPLLPCVTNTLWCLLWLTVMYTVQWTEDSAKTALAVLNSGWIVLMLVNYVYKSYKTKYVPKNELYINISIIAGWCYILYKTYL